ncbi:hypothetical protein GOP47_0000751 [Adiantum capillus-veneris]|uniref:Uncharacterized protein n=1 Tax=Adiantum capillus-veneris TaxID=13818 RepID=A0A9D4VFQ2_ADICA|nr:hypothetical protein GOP47_0000751 [Adiantum capillus-veneris]
MSFQNPFSFRVGFGTPPPRRPPTLQPTYSTPVSHHTLPGDLNLMSQTQEEDMLGDFSPAGHLSPSPHQPRRVAVTLNTTQSVPLNTNLFPSHFRENLSRNPVALSHALVDVHHLQGTAKDSTPNAPSKKGRRSGRNGNKKAAPKTKKAPSGRFHWDLRAQVVLLEWKKAYDDKRCSVDLYQKIKTNEEQWVDIVALCALQGLVVDWQQAYEKHKRLNALYREINDWERNTPSGKDSYWAMTPAERVAEGKFSHCNFPVELYELMDRLFGMDKAVNPSATVVDTSNGIPCRNSNSSPHVVDPTIDATSFDNTSMNGGVKKKTRKRTHTFDVGLTEATKDQY